MRIALFGGTFDPPHRGHLAVAEAAVRLLGLNRVLMAPVALQPLKRELPPSSFADRLRMVELAVEGHPKLVASRADEPQPGGRPNYSIETLQKLKQEMARGDELFCLMGADSFLTLKKWHRAAELVVCCDFIVASRPGVATGQFGLGDLAGAMPDGVTLDRAERGPGYLALRAHSEVSGHASTIYLLPEVRVDVSATEVRRVLGNGDIEESPLQPQVVRYIVDHGLYR